MERKTNETWIVKKLQQYFFWHGQKIAQRPYSVILVSFLLLGYPMIGLLNYKTESNPKNIWMPTDSEFVKNAKWWENTYPPKIRSHSIIVTASNVLRPEVLRFVLNIHQRLANFRTSNGLTWDKKCLKIPVYPQNNIEAFDEIDPEKLPIFNDYEDYYYDEYIDNSDVKARQSRSTNDPDISVELYPEEYCKIFDLAGKPTCAETSIIELWARKGFNSSETETEIYSLTKEDILADINSKNFSEVFMYNKDFTTMLGGIKRNSSNGQIISATATEIKFYGLVNVNDIVNDEQESNNPLKNTFSNGQPADPKTLEFEKSLAEMFQKILTEEAPAQGNSAENRVRKFKIDIRTYFKLENSYYDETGKSVESDFFRVLIGLCLVYAYVLIMIGGFECIQQKPYLGGIGLFNIVLALLSSYGICSTIGLVFTPAHPLIPFLLLGIGIDDMFVIVQCLSNVEDSDPTFKDKSIDLLVGETLKHAGVAITITSFTDFAVLIVGTITELPGLQSFCIYSAIGILLVFILQTTLFTACLALDIKRIRSNRNGYFPCYQTKKSDDDSDIRKRPVWWVKNPGKSFFRKYGEILMHPVSKFLVISFTIGLTSVGIYGMTKLEQGFDPVQYLPSKSYVGNWIQIKEKYFGSDERAVIVIGEIDYENELWKLSELEKNLEKEKEIIGSINSWLSEFKNYVDYNDLLDGKELFDAENNMAVTNMTEFYYRLTQFLHSPRGLKYQNYFEFDSQIQCGSLSPKIKLTQIEFTHRLFNGRTERIQGLEKTTEIIKSFNFSSHAFAVAEDYGWNEIDLVVTRETFQNISISMVCVFVASGLLLAHFKSCTLVFLCVVLSMIDLAGFMYFWNLKIDIFSYGCLVISVGLCIDYAAHIAHTFMICSEENGDEKSIKTLGNIGPAVMNGGFSTFLAFVVTCTAESHPYITFFRIMFLIISFALYHGLVFLPVMLSILEFKLPCHKKDSNRVIPQV